MMQKLLPGMVVGIALFLVVKYPSDSAEWVASAAGTIGDIFDSFLSFLKELIQ